MQIQLLKLQEKSFYINNNKLVFPKVKMHNCHIIIDDKGELKDVYKKLHLFDVSIPEKNVNLRESDYVLGGSKIVKPINTPAGAIGLSIVSFFFIVYRNSYLYINAASLSLWGIWFLVEAKTSQWRESIQYFFVQLNKLHRKMYFETSTVN